MNKTQATQGKTTDFSKLTAFVEAALTNPAHPVFQLGLTHSPILQHYAVNVRLLCALTPAQWFEQYPQKRAVIESVMAICEAGDDETDADEAPAAPAKKAAKASDKRESKTVAELRQQVADLSAKVTELLAAKTGAAAESTQGATETKTDDAAAEDDTADAGGEDDELGEYEES